MATPSATPTPNVSRLPPSPSELEVGIGEALAALAGDPQAVVHFAKLLNLANQYVQKPANDDATDSKVVQFREHQLCVRCETDRQDEKGKEEERIFRFLLQTCMLRSLAFLIKGKVALWTQALFDSIYSCADCYKGFLRAKNDVGPLFLAVFEQANVAKFLDHVLQWEEGLAMERLRKMDCAKQEEGQADGKSVRQLSGAETYAMLELTGILSSKGNRQGLYVQLREDRERLSIHLLPEVSAGLLVFTMDEDQSVRDWAERQIEQFQIFTASTESISPMIGLLAGQAIKTGQWHVFSSALSMAPAAFEGSALPNTLLANLTPDEAQATSILLCLQKLLEQKAGSIWRQEDSEYPLVVLSTILDSKNFENCYTSHAATPTVFAWIRPFIDSISSIPHVEGAIPRNNSDPQDDAAASQPRDTTKAFDEGLKRVLHFLLERVQRISTPLPSRTFAVTHAMALLAHCARAVEKCVAVKNDDRVHVSSSTANDTLRQVCALHSGSIASLAFRGKLPNSSDVLSSEEHEARGQAFGLIDTIFRIDSFAMLSSIFALSERSARQQRAYKRLIKELSTRPRKENADAAKEEEEKAIGSLFTQAASDVDIAVTICSDLWKNSYNLCRPGIHVQHFLAPLSRLSACVEPQINTYIVVVKERYAETAAYTQYKEKLKGAILSVSRRLRAMRGSLPLLLLDLSEDSTSMGSSQTAGSGHTMELPALCFRLADGLMSASLCAEPDVHKAAQNVIRAAFEDAETRADCFRSLLQCSPKLAFQGAQGFLERFVEAASVLLEANDSAKWMVRSFSDILDVLCSETDGLLRTGTPFSFIDDDNSLTQLHTFLPAIWLLMCKSVAIIFKRTPSWSRILPHDELTAWFRDVILFATEAVTHVKLIQNAATKTMKSLIDGTEEERQVRQDILADLSLPLEEASSWFRMNDLGIVQETRDYFVEGLRCFQNDKESSLPDGVKERMLAFIDSQSKIIDDNERTTLLSLSELAELRLLLDPRHSSPTISVASAASDSAYDDDGDVVIEKVIEGSSTSAENVRKDKSQIASSISSALAKGNESIDVKASPSVQEKARMKQSRLQFQPINTEEARKKPFESKEAPLPPQPRFSTSGRAVNRYQGAIARPVPGSAQASRTSERPTSKMAQLRQDFRATHTVWKPNNNARFGALNRELGEPRAPEAKRSFANASPAHTTAVRSELASTKPLEADSSDSSSDEEDSSADEKVGLADLSSSKKSSPAKMRAKPRTFQPTVRRSAIMLEDQAARRAQIEREEAERKRRLREAPNFSPLHRTILSWDYWAEGDSPPHLREMAKPLASIRPTYRNPEDYVSTFEPMLLLECWAEVQAAREQIAKGANDFLASSATVSGRSNTDSFDSIALTMQPAVRGASQIFFQDTDILYIRESNAVTGGGQRKVVLAKVDAFKLHPHGSRLTVRCCVTGDRRGMSSVLVAGAKLEIGKMLSLTTLHRAYEALHALRFYDMLPSILLARAAVPERLAEHEVDQAKKAYSVNEPQARAILTAIRAQAGFHLIQGPPGTGKTKTICSLVAHFLQHRKAPSMPIRAGHGGNVHAAAGGMLSVKKKILLCAPSNAALDEVAKRVHQGVRLADGKLLKPVVVRVGREEAMNIAVKAISLEANVEKRLSAQESSSSQTQNGLSDPAQMQAEIRSLNDQRDNKRAEVEHARASNVSNKVVDQLEAELRNIISKRMDLMGKLDVAKDQRQRVTRHNEANRKRIQQEILMQADVVCSTLGGAGHHVLSSLPIDFETVVIDEAAQAVELDTLIPLRYGCQRCIMVGDPNQLPPTVISREAERLNYSQSLFSRLFNNPNNSSNLLSIQYRMHPHISLFPSEAFYDGKLEDGPNMRALTEKAWHSDDLLRPLRFFDCRNSQEAVGRSAGHSLVNRAEADMAAAVYERLRRAASREQGTVSQALDGKVGVVTMYKDQVRELKRAFRAVYGEGIEDVVDFNTVDGFQGQEKDVIILSCVRSNGIGFLNDRRRINVAITRAKSNLFIIGNVPNLEKNDRHGFWKQFITIAKQNNDLRTLTSDAFRKPFDTFAAAAAAAAPHASPPRKGSTIALSKPTKRSAPPANGTSKEPLSNGKTTQAQPIGSSKSSIAGVKRSGDDVSADPTSHATMPKKPKLPHSTPPQASLPNRPRGPPTSAALSVRQSQRPPALPPRKTGVPINVPGQIPVGPQRLTTRPRPPRPRPPPHVRPPARSQDGPSAQATASLFMPKPSVRPAQRRRY